MKPDNRPDRRGRAPQRALRRYPHSINHLASNEAWRCDLQQAKYRRFYQAPSYEIERAMNTNRRPDLSTAHLRNRQREAAQIRRDSRANQRLVSCRRYFDYRSRVDNAITWPETPRKWSALEQVRLPVRSERQIPIPAPATSVSNGYVRPGCVLHTSAPRAASHKLTVPSDEPPTGCRP